jgi:hypothetical protein
MSYFRTPEHRSRQSLAIRRWPPWEESTGPKSVEGKAKSARNSYQGGWRETLRKLARQLRGLDVTDERIARRGAPDVRAST